MDKEMTWRGRWCRLRGSHRAIAGLGTPNLRASHWNLSDGASQLGEEKPWRREVEALGSKHRLLSAASGCVWTLSFRSEVARGPSKPAQAMPWISESEHAKKLSDFAKSHSTTGIAAGDCETLDSKTASGPQKNPDGDIRKSLQ